MIQIQFSNISLTLGARSIFHQINWEIQHDQRIGLIGYNGAGKSSLFKLIVEEFTPEPGGTITRAKGISVGYLAQEPQLDEHQSVLDLALGGNLRINEIMQLLAAVEIRLGDPFIYGDEKRLAKVLDEQQHLLEEYQSLGGDQYAARVKTILRDLGMEKVDFSKPAGLLSGGQKKLVGLARLIVAQPSVLLLDEPDNHLDLQAKQNLERMILNYPGAVVIISHDRYLLDATVTHIAELADGSLSMFQGDYSSYIMEKQQKLARQDELFHVQQRQVARIEAAIKRYAIWAKTYDSEKFAKRAKAIQNRLDRMERIDRPILERKRMDLRLNGWRGSTKVIEFKQASKSFDGKSVIKPANILLHHGERVGVIGRNGTGKSVLLKLANGQLTPDGGEVLIGPSVKIGYYSQQHETLLADDTVLNTVQMAGNMGESNAVSLLQRYLFTYRQVRQKVSELSGGERSRLQLALMVLSGANLLLMDEPTNNLDIASAEVLESALADFEGTVLVVSHDRYFLDQLVDRILVLEDGSLQSFSGGYSDYLQRKK